MAGHKVRKETEPFREIRYWSVMMTCTCGRTFKGQAGDSGRSDEHRLKRLAKEKAEQAFRNHIPIR